jgi:hypothetical protein
MPKPCFQEQFNGVGVFHTVQGHRLAFFKTDADFFGFHHTVVAPEGYAHDGVDDLHAA